MKPKKLPKHRKNLEMEVMEGIIAAECGNNAVTGGSLIPLLTLGIREVHLQLFSSAL